MNRLSIVMTMLAVLGLALAGMPNAAAQPPCTCDPLPVDPKDLFGPPEDPPEDPVGDAVAEAEATVSMLYGDAKALVQELDPRNWPCTCDPVD